MRKALCIGINDYPGCPLTGCENDAEVVSEALKRNYDGSKNFDARCETCMVSRSEMYQTIDELFSGTGDAVLFYYSGHGCVEKNKGYLVTPDGRKGDWGVSIDEVMNLANNSRYTNKFIIIDACHSGIAGTNPLAPDCSEIIEGMTIMSACSKDQNALDGDIHGVFTRLLLEGLSGGASDLQGYVTAGGLYAYIDRCLGPWDQRPVFKTNVSSFSPISRARPPIDLDTLKQLPLIFSSPDGHYALDPSYEFTNDPQCPHEYIRPYANPDRVQIFKALQKMESVGLVAPVGEEHMYFAAMNSKCCRLTEVGKYYYNLIKGEKL